MSITARFRPAGTTLAALALAAAVVTPSVASAQTAPAAARPNRVNLAATCDLDIGLPTQNGGQVTATGTVTCTEQVQLIQLRVQLLRDSAVAGNALGNSPAPTTTFGLTAVAPCSTGSWVTTARARVVFADGTVAENGGFNPPVPQTVPIFC